MVEINPNITITINVNSLKWKSAYKQQNKVKQKIRMT